MIEYLAGSFPIGFCLAFLSKLLVCSVVAISSSRVSSGKRAPGSAWSPPTASSGSGARSSWWWLQLAVRTRRSCQSSWGWERPTTPRWGLPSFRSSARAEPIEWQKQFQSCVQSLKCPPKRKYFDFFTSLLCMELKFCSNNVLARNTNQSLI